MPAIEASARAVDAIVAKGEAVYGINTGFGKLASVRIADRDLAALQRNIVLSHAAGVGEPMPPAIVRLMMALKLASLGRGASGVRRDDLIAMLHAMLARNVVPVIPSQGSVGASGDLAPLAHLAAAMIGDRRSFATAASACRPAMRSRAPGCAPVVLGPKEGLALLNGTQFSTAARARRPVRDRARVPGGAGHRRAVDRCRQAAPTRRSMRASTRCAAIAGRSRWRPRCAALMAGSAIRASHRTSTTTACRTLIACAASRR